MECRNPNFLINLRVISTWINLSAFVTVKKIIDKQGVQGRMVLDKKKIIFFKLIFLGSVDAICDLVAIRGPC